jgi:hypothetical protein
MIVCIRRFVEHPPAGEAGPVDGDVASIESEDSPQFTAVAYGGGPDYDLYQNAVKVAFYTHKPARTTLQANFLDWAAMLDTAAIANDVAAATLTKSNSAETKQVTNPQTQ